MTMTDFQKRENGFYWIKWADRWIMAEWDDGQDWYLPGFENYFEDSDFEEIDERQIERPDHLIKSIREKVEAYECLGKADILEILNSEAQ